jgi:uncharacterized membrane protein YgcG
MSRAALAQKPMAPTVSSAQSAVQRRSFDERTADVGLAAPRFSAALSALPATASVQRSCSACEASEETPKTRRLSAPPGSTIDAGVQDEETRPRARAVEGADASNDDDEKVAVQPRLEVGPADDRYEREADAIAARTLAMPAPTAVPAQDPARPVADLAYMAGADTAGVRRKCASCSDEDTKVRPLREHAAEPRLAASSTTLTGGGRPLPDQTRSFFEDRMGRDLGDVRVHDGGESERLNGSISAHAFTYGSHIWLGQGERVDTGFTMAHELAHVLQQTQPGTVRPRRTAQATTAAPKVQRLGDLRTFWLPAGARNKGELGLHTRMHNIAADMLATQNTGKSIIREAPIPGGNSGGSTASPLRALDKIKGFADIYEGSTTVGLQKNVAELKKTGSNKAPINNFHGSKKKGAQKVSGKSLVSFDHIAERAPKFNTKTQTVTDLNRAPTSINIADVKPGHNVTARSAGVGQIQNYVDGINDVVATTNGFLPAGQTWPCKVQHMPSKGLAVAEGWDPGIAKMGGSSPKLKLHHKGQDIPFKVGSGAVKTDIRGRWVVTEDPHNKGIWTYFLLPDQASLDAALADPKAESKFTTVSGKLKTLVLDDLLKAPKAPRPRRRAGPSGRVSRSARMVRRKGPKGAAKPTPPKDNFDYKKWNQKRVGKNRNDETSFRGVLNKTFPAADQDYIEFQKNAADSVKLIRENFGMERKVRDADRIETNGQLMQKFRFWVSPKGGVMGRLRAIFGTAFIKVWGLAEKAKAWIAKQTERFAFKGAAKAGGLKGVAMKVGAMVLKSVGDIMIRKTAQAMIDCVTTGLTRTMDELTSGSIESLEAKIAEIEAFVHNAQSRLLAKIDTMLGGGLTKLQADLDKLKGDLAFVTELVGVIKTAIDTARVAVCVAGGLESFGISCAVAVIDKVLSLMEISPVDTIAGALMESCEAQAIVAKFMAASAFVQSFPNRIAKAVMGEVRGALPPSLQGLVCKDEDFKVEAFDPKDLNCKSGGGGGGGSGSGSGKGAEGEKGGGKSGKSGDGGADRAPAESKGGAGGKDHGEGGIPVTTPKPLPANFKGKNATIPAFMLEGMPDKDSLTPGKAVPVTLVVVRNEKKGGATPIVAIKEVQVKFFEIGEKNATGFVTYKVKIANSFYVEEIQSAIYSTPDDKAPYDLSGIP